MERSRFDQLTRQIAGVSSSRGFKPAIGGRRSLLAAVVVAVATGVGTGGVDAGKRRKQKKRKKARPNEFGCLDVGKPCQNEEQCCSGVCEGKKGKRTCRAHDTGTCQQDGQLVPCNNRSNCGCFRTTASSDVCAELFPPSACAECRRDADCEALGFPPGSACGLAPFPCEHGAMACYVPCGKAPPA